ncbi:MAG: aminotransferase class V-fold PLP-dependent enzyme, partial [Paludibacter sp.]
MLELNNNNTNYKSLQTKEILYPSPFGEGVRRTEEVGDFGGFDIGRLRDIAGEFCQEELHQVASQVIPDDINLESVFASFSQLQNPPGISSGGLILPDFAAGLPFTTELGGLFFPDIENPSKQQDLSSAAQNQFADNSYSDYSFLRDQEFSYANRDVFDVQAIRKDFPILHQKVNGKDLIWFDNAATTQKPAHVINTLTRFYQHDNSNIHRAAHTLAARSTDAYEDARGKVKTFINASSTDEIIFVRGTTEGINLVIHRASCGRGTKTQHEAH